MAIESTLPEVVSFAGGREHRTPTAPGAAALRGLFALCGNWLCQRNDDVRLHEMEVHLARDIGATPARGRCPEGFAVDPAPLWGVGLTPQPTDTRSPWTERCRG